MRRSAAPNSDIRQVLVETFAASGRMNQLVLDHLDPRVWRAKPSGAGHQQGRTIAAIFAHLHNNRLVWLKRSVPHLKRPAALDPFRCTMKQTAAAHRNSTARCLAMLEEALSDNPNRRVPIFSRGSWASEWPAGATMFAYMFAHDAHHRGQILALAHQLGYRVSEDAACIWRWDKLWKDLGFPAGPR